MYNISQAAARAGVTVPVLRAWERRYGIVQPARTPAGYRRFDDQAVARIRAMRALVDDGWSPSAAAAAILAGQAPTAIPAVEGGPGPTGAPTKVSPDASTSEAAAIGQRFVDAARALDAGAVASVLDDLFSRGSFERVVTDLLFPALEDLGDAWAAGEVSVAGEHLASNAVLRRLGLALDAAGQTSGRAGSIVVGLPPGGRHELGALAFAVAARRAGLPVAYLGPDLPIDDWVSAASGAAAAVIGVVAPRDRKAALEVAHRLHAAHPELVVALGGRSAPASTDLIRLPERLADAVAAMEGVLASPRATPERDST